MLEGESDEKRVEDELEVEAAGQEQEEEEGDFLQSRLVEVAVRCTTDGNALALPPPCLQRLSTEKASQAGPTAYSRGGKPKAGREEGMSIRKKKRKTMNALIDKIAPQKRNQEAAGVLVLPRGSHHTLGCRPKTLSPRQHAFLLVQ